MCRRINSTQLERWYGKEWVEDTVNNMKGWYGNPIPCGGNHGDVTVDAEGYFSGDLKCGKFASYLDFNEDRWRSVWKKLKRLSKNQMSMLQLGGLASLAEFLEEMRYRRQVQPISKTATTSAASAAISFWVNNAAPMAGPAGAGAAPGGEVYTSSSNGAMAIINPAAGERMFFAGASIAKTGGSNTQSILLYDRLFGVAKTMLSITAQAVTGVPTRYQSLNNLDMDAAVGNFLTIEVGSTLNANAHNWTVCTYTNENGNAATLPSIAGQASLATSRIDLPANHWFCPLAARDRGIKALTQMQCDAGALSGQINFIIGHPIAWLPLYDGSQIVLDGLMGGFGLTRIFDSACLNFLAMHTNSTTISFSGSINIISR